MKMSPEWLLYLLIAGFSAAIYVFLRWRGNSSIRAEKIAEKSEIIIFALVLVLLVIITVIFS